MSRPLTIRVTDTAEADLAEIWSYLAAEASEAIATRFLTTLRERFTQAAYHPYSGAGRDHLAPGLRVIFYQAYAAYYTATETETVIVRVIHGVRDIAALADRGGFENEP